MDHEVLIWWIRIAHLYVSGMVGFACLAAASVLADDNNFKKRHLTEIFKMALVWPLVIPLVMIDLTKHLWNLMCIDK